MTQHTNESITGLKGIGEKTAKLFQKLNILTIDDLLNDFPRSYEAFEAPILLADAPLGQAVTVQLAITGDFFYKKYASVGVGTVSAADETGQKITVTFFNAPFMRNALKRGNRYMMRGQIRRDGKNALHLDQPKLYAPAEYAALQNTLQPRYALTKGLTNHAIGKAMAQALLLMQEDEYLPSDLLSEYHLIHRKEAYQQIHFPQNEEALLKARERLVFDEFFLLFMQMQHLKGENGSKRPTAFPMMETADTNRLIEALPYQLTNGQKRAFKEIKDDLTSGYAMNRLIQGDVGCGKTILAFLSLLMAVANGYQGAMMAPTELLAKQHYEQLLQMTQKYHLPIKPVLLTGSVTASTKKKCYEEIKNGEVNVIIGTHALIQEKVLYKNLALVITDEQHRFGVRQREEFSEKGAGAHVLVMSATPIPRTLAIILYGDLNLSVIEEKPSNRLPIKNCVVGKQYHQKSIAFLEKEIRSGRQAYIICPMVEAGEETENQANVLDYTLQLKKELPNDIQVSALHGRMKASEKDRIMQAFADGNIDVLVATTVIEVGINVSNATVMIVENAERFGLAQLHQLRGRIGRGSEQSYCIFVDGSGKDAPSERLSVLNRSNDGFEIANEDLKLRGPGDLFGVRQSGDLQFRIADIYQDHLILQRISQTVERLMMMDPDLTAENHLALKEYLLQNSGNFIDFRTI